MLQQMNFKLSKITKHSLVSINITKNKVLGNKLS